MRPSDHQFALRSIHYYLGGRRDINLRLLRLNLHQVRSAGIAERDRLCIVVENHHETLLAAPYLDRRRGRRPAFVLRQLVLTPPGARPERPRDIARFELDPYSGSLRRNSKETFVVSRIRQGGERPTCCYGAQHVGYGGL